MSRRAVRARPRIVLWTVLAFVCASMRPTLHVLPHRHPGDDRPHVHAAFALDGIVPAPTASHALAGEPSTRAHGHALAAAPSGKLHTHLVQLAHGSAVGARTEMPTFFRATPLTSTPQRQAPSERVHRASARAPPSLA